MFQEATFSALSRPLPGELDHATAASLFTEAQRLVNAGATVLEGSYNRNVRVDHPQLGAVLVRIPKRSASLPANLRTWWEPDILRAVQKTIDVPQLLYATPGFARRDGDFQIHRFREMQPLPPRPNPVPNALVERDIPRFFRDLAAVTDLPPAPPGRPQGTDAQAYADVQLAFLDGLWQHVNAAWPELYERLGFPRRPITPARRALDGTSPVPLVLIHPDLWRGNMHRSRGSTVFIDHEFVTRGDPRHALAYTLDESGYTPSQEKRLTANVVDALHLPTQGLEKALQGWTTWAHVQTALRSPARIAASMQSMTPEQVQARLEKTTWLAGIVDRVATTYWGRPALTHEQVADALRSVAPDSPKRHARKPPASAVRASPDTTQRARPQPPAPHRQATPHPNHANAPAAHTELAAQGLAPLRSLHTKPALTRTTANTNTNPTTLSSGPSAHQAKDLALKLSRTLGDR
ncbi:hypothetical protein [Yinghuangia sp. YIM S09857]|uniref:hypothetical protein n=1 Tax=Yinghuangia sp. YIM S09857 TaxID=3436929 RepID=UPI003F52F717